MVVIIPAYQPDEKLYRLVLDLHEQTDFDLVIVDDGSDPDRRDLFASLEPYAKVLKHPQNRGKGGNEWVFWPCLDASNNCRCPSCKYHCILLT